LFSSSNEDIDDAIGDGNTGVATTFVSSVFNWKTLRFDTFVGCMVAGSYGLASLWLSFWILKIVKRMKKCADFSLTAFSIHMVITWIQSGFPNSLPWWVCMGASFAMTAFLSEWLCSREELAEIPLSSFLVESLNAPRGDEGDAAEQGRGTVWPNSNTPNDHGVTMVPIVKIQPEQQQPKQR